MGTAEKQALDQGRGKVSGGYRETLELLNGPEDAHDLTEDADFVLG